MRTIEFRGLRTDGNGWAYGYYFTNGKDHGIIDNAFFLGSWTPIRPETVGQFIGRIDIHGKKVYEDDLFKCQNGRVWRIEYDEAKSEFMASKAERRVEGTPLRNLEVVEVVGNIHEPY